MVAMESELANLLTPSGVEWSDAQQKAAGLYPQQVTFKQLAAVLVATHPHALDYLTQCPALISAISKSSTAWQAVHYELLAKQFGWRVAESPKLRDLMRLFGLPMPVRKLHGMAVSPRRWDALQMIATADPRVIASCIPERTTHQIGWMNGCQTWAACLKFRQVIPAANVVSARAEWFMQAWSRYIVAMPLQEVQRLRIDTTIVDVLDFSASREIREGQIPFDEKWTWEQARTASTRWHALINAQKITETFKRDFGLDVDDEWSTDPWPSVTRSVAGFEFVPLNTGMKVVTEGDAMHHCLRSYLERLVLGKEYVAYSVQGYDGNRVATLGIARQKVKNAAEFAKQVRAGTSAVNRATWKIDQIKGHCNAGVRKDIADACRMFFNTAF